MSNLIVEIVEVEDVLEHPNADRLEIIKIKGWQTVYGKGLLMKGELMIYVPIDSVLPDEILSKLPIKISKGRVRTIKLRKIVSQGLLLNPVEFLPKHTKIKKGMDVKDLLKIEKWEPKIPVTNIRSYMNKSSKKKVNPHFNKYTNIDNIKNYNKVFKKGDEIVILEKIHGSNFRAGNVPAVSFNIFERFWNFITKKQYQFIYGSRNVQLKGLKQTTYYGEDVYGKMAERYELANKIPDNMVFFGEIYGDGIQDMKYGMKAEIDVVFFDIYDVENKKYLDWEEAEQIFDVLELPIVPVLFRGKFTNERLEKYTEGKTLLGEDKELLREGVAIKSLKEDFHAGIGRKILKSISNEYLLRKHGTEFH